MRAGLEDSLREKGAGRDGGCVCVFWGGKGRE